MYVIASGFPDPMFCEAISCIYQETASRFAEASQDRSEGAGLLHPRSDVNSVSI